MISKPVHALFALSLAAALPALAQNAVTVNGKAIPASAVETMVKQAVAQGAPDNAQTREMAKQELIAREVVLQEAGKQNVGNSAEFKSELENVRQSAMIQAMLRDYTVKNPVKDAEIKAEYDKAKAASAKSPNKEHNASHILVETEAQAKDIIAKLRGGAKFADLAKGTKDTGSAAKGGELGWAPAGTYVPEFTQALDTLKKGAITDTPVKSQFGYHVIRLNDTRSAAFPDLKDVRDQIAGRLQQRKVATLVEGLVKKAKVQ